MFSINHTTGWIYLQAGLDRERTRSHAVRVEAYDLGLPTPLQSDLDLTILVVNVNDHQPQFIVDEYSVSLTERREAGLERRRVLNTVDLDAVEEGETETTVCYFLVAGNHQGIFQLDKLTHELMTLEQLDREAVSQYELIVKASEDCSSVPEAVPAFQAEDDTLLRLTVHVEDVNDNRPAFDRDVFTGGVSTDIGFGTKFMRVSATDRDAGINAEVEYTMCSEVERVDAEGFGAESRQLFLVEAATGEVVLNFDPQENQKGYFGFDVCAEDKGLGWEGEGEAGTGRARVIVYLLREDQRVKFVTRSQPEEIRLGLVFSNSSIMEGNIISLYILSF